MNKIRLPTCPRAHLGWAAWETVPRQSSGRLAEYNRGLMNIQGKKVLVTGITGFIGGALAARLNALGASVRGISRDAGKAARSPYEVTIGDISDLNSIRPAFEAAEIVIHSAALVSERADPALLRSVNVAGVENVIKAGREAGVERLVHVSSCAVYGSPQVFGVDEMTPLKESGSPYHVSKVQAERTIFESGGLDGMQVVIARPSQVYGPGSEQFTLRPMRAILSGRMFLIDGGRYMCKPVFIENLVDGLLLCATHADAPTQAFNLTDGYVLPWRVFFGAYAHMVGVKKLPSLPYPAAWLAALAFEAVAKVKAQEPNVNRRAIQSLRSMNSFSNRKARRVLDWEPSVGFEEGMKRTESWLRACGVLPAAN